MQKFHFLITEELEDERIDKALTELTDDTVSRTFLQKLIKEKQVYVNDKPEKASYRLKCDDVVTFEIPDQVEPEIEAENIQRMCIKMKNFTFLC